MGCGSRERGVVYVATGRPDYLGMALRSARRLIELEPGSEVVILTDRAADADRCVSAGVCHGLVRPARWTARPSRSIKTRLHRFSPFRETLYLDADVVPLRPWAGVWSHLRDGSIGAVRDDWTVGAAGHGKSRLRRHAIRQLGADRPMFNGGVLLWRSGPEVSAGFDRWFMQWRRFADVDQYALAMSGAALHPIPDCFNDQGDGDAQAAAARGAVFWHPHRHKPAWFGVEGAGPPSRWTIRRQWLAEKFDRVLGLSHRADRFRVGWSHPAATAPGRAGGPC